jgi:hypothetical protein
MFMLKQLIDKRRELNKETYVAFMFIDCVKAFDKVSWEKYLGQY